MHIFTYVSPPPGTTVPKISLIVVRGGTFSVECVCVCVPVLRVCVCVYCVACLKNTSA